MLNTTGAHPQLGQTLSVRVVNRNQPDVMGVTGIEVDSDDVRLDASPTVAVAIGALTGRGLTLCLMTLGSLRARRES